MRLGGTMDARKDGAALSRVARGAQMEYGFDDYAALVRRCRSYRRFDEDDPIELGVLLGLVDCARLSSCGNNMQRLRFHVVSAAEERAAVFATLGWAALLKDWDGPAEGQRPTGYVVILYEGEPSTIRHMDVGIAAQTIMLGATEAGYHGCMLRNFKPAPLLEACGLGESGLVPELVVALGRAGEEVVLEEADPTGADGHGLVYWRDERGTHHVPKLPLADVLV